MTLVWKEREILKTRDSKLTQIHTKGTETLPGDTTGEKEEHACPGAAPAPFAVCPSPPWISRVWRGSGVSSPGGSDKRGGVILRDTGARQRRYRQEAEGNRAAAPHAAVPRFVHEEAALRAAETTQERGSRGTGAAVRAALRGHRERAEGQNADGGVGVKARRMPCVGDVNVTSAAPPSPAVPTV